MLRLQYIRDVKQTKRWRLENKRWFSSPKEITNYLCSRSSYLMLFYSIFQLKFWTKMMNNLRNNVTVLHITLLKGYMKWKFWFEENPFIWKNFRNYKDWSLQLSRISLQSWDISMNSLHNDLLGIKYIFEIIPLNRSKVCWFSASGYIHTFTVLSDSVRQPQWYSWFPQTSLCSVTYAVELFTYISNKSTYLKTEVRYATAVKPIFITSKVL